MSPLRGACVLLVVATSACFSDNGPGVLSGASSATATATSSAGASTSDLSTGGATTTPVTTSDTGGPITTGAPLCRGLGQSCGGDGDCCGECLACGGQLSLCIPKADLCGPCEQCDELGACVPAPASTPCNDTVCPGLVSGHSEGACYAYAPAVGTCDGGGACTSPPCSGQGAMIASCASPKCLLEKVCVVDTPAAAVTFETLCAVEKPGPSCKPVCNDNLSSSTTTSIACDATADCVDLGDMNCGGYRCDANLEACLQSCTNDEECALTHFCQEGMCVPN